MIEHYVADNEGLEFGHPIKYIFDEILLFHGFGFLLKEFIGYYTGLSQSTGNRRVRQEVFMDIEFKVISFAVLVFSVVVHEVAHGYVAMLVGDPTAKLAGRLSLNPIRHVDLLGTIIVPIITTLAGTAFGWALPVPVNPAYFRKPRRDNVLVSIAGVSANMVIAVICGLILRILYSDPAVAQSLPRSLLIVLLSGCLVNVSLAVFNMLPIPPLDGSHVVAALLPRSMVAAYMGIGSFGIIILVIFMSSIGRIISPIMLAVVSLLSGISFRG